MTYTFQLGNPHTQVHIYHVHLRTHQESALFGEMQDAVVLLNEAGRMVAEEWQWSAESYRGIRLDEWGVLPNGIRALVLVDEADYIHPKGTYGRMRSQLKPRSLNAFIAGFKATAAKRINLMSGQLGLPVWERSYHEQRIDDAVTLERIRQLLARTHEPSVSPLLD